MGTNIKRVTGKAQVYLESSCENAPFMFRESDISDTEHKSVCETCVLRRRRRYAAASAWTTHLLLCSDSRRHCLKPIDCELTTLRSCSFSNTMSKLTYSTNPFHHGLFFYPSDLLHRLARTSSYFLLFFW